MQEQRTAPAGLLARTVEEDRGHDTPCWIWQGATTTGGYAEGWNGHKPIYVHRALYEATHGPIPCGLSIDHLCRVRACVNPAHLEPVTNAVNVQRGKKAKLNPDLVIEIRAASEAGATRKGLARRYGVDPKTIRDIVNRRSWRNI